MPLTSLLMLLSYGVLADEPTLPVLNWEPRSDWVNVKEHGAVGDGTADDTAAIQAVLDQVVDGTTVYLPPGTYRITSTLKLVGPRHGFTLIGQGRETKLSWGGPAGGKLFMDDGVAYSRYVGLVFEGHGQAAIGFWHYSDHRFETEVRHQYLAFTDFTEAGLLADPHDKYALAETTFEHCLFERCATGVSFTQFNDYDFTFDGSEFRDCGVGLHCSHGNYYVRDCRFDRSTKVDILSLPEHACSVRRCISVGSNAFIDHQNSVTPLTIESCWVKGWTRPEGCIGLNSPPVLLFDGRFEGGPDGSVPVRLNKGNQRLLTCGNEVVGGGPVVKPPPNAKVYELPAGQLGPSLTSVDHHFLDEPTRVPGRVFDAKRDYGAAGDGKTDDTAAIQRTIDAARAYRRDAIAYLPTGVYALTDTLRLTGGGYRVGGSGWRTRLTWAGADGGTMLRIEHPQGLVLEEMSIGTHDVGQMNNGLDVEQVGGDGPSKMTYDGVFVYGMYQRQPHRKGLKLSGLGPGEVVLMPHVQGNLQIVDSARATILGNCTYEGSITVEGKSPERDGLLGFMTRLATLVTHGLYLRDSQNIVMSDFYLEQANNGLVFEGNPGDPAGRATIAGAKLQFTVGKTEEAKGTAVDIRGYHGRIVLGPDQIYHDPPATRILQSGEQPVELTLLGLSFYAAHLAPEITDKAKLSIVGCEAVGMKDDPFRAEDSFDEETLAGVGAALDDYRRLGAADLKLNHGWTH